MAVRLGFLGHDTGGCRRQELPFLVWVGLLRASYFRGVHRLDGYVEGQSYSERGRCSQTTFEPCPRALRPKRLATPLCAFVSRV